MAMRKPKKPRSKSPQTRWTRDAVKEKYWRTQIALWQDSGLSVRAFCKDHGVVETSFYAWRRELIVRARENNTPDELMDSERVTPNILKDGRGRNVSIRFRQTDHRALQKSLVVQESTGSPFVPLSVVPDEPPSARSEAVSHPGITLTTPSGYRISVNTSDDVDLLAKILATLEKNKC